MKISKLLRRVSIGLILSFCLIAGFSNDIVYATESDLGNLGGNSVVEVEGFVIDGGYLEAGKQNTVTLTLQNTNRYTVASNLVVAISSNSGMIYPAYGDDNHFYVAEKLPHSIKDRILGIDGPGAYGTTFNQVWVKLSADAITYAHEVLHFYDDWYDLTPWYSQDAAEKLTYSMEKIVEIANNVKNILDYHINADADELPRSWNQGLRIGYLNLHDNKVATAQSDDTELVFFEILKKHFGLRVSCGCLLEYVKSKSSNPNIQCLNCEGLPDVLK